MLLTNILLFFILIVLIGIFGMLANVHEKLEKKKEVTPMWIERAATDLAEFRKQEEHRRKEGS